MLKHLGEHQVPLWLLVAHVYDRNQVRVTVGTAGLSGNGGYLWRVSSFPKVSDAFSWEKKKRSVSGGKKDPCGHPLGTGSTSCGCPRAGAGGPAGPACHTASPRAGAAGWEPLTAAPVDQAAKLWPQEILISRNKSLFHLTGQSFPMV